MNQTSKNCSKIHPICNKQCSKIVQKMTENCLKIIQIIQNYSKLPKIGQKLLQNAFINSLKLLKNSAKLLKKYPKIAQRFPKIVKKLPTITQKLPKTGQNVTKLSTALVEIFCHHFMSLMSQWRTSNIFNTWTLETADFCLELAKF